MHPSIVAKRQQLAELCKRYGVARLEVFGSAARGGDFDPARSDIDLLVVFDPESGMSPVERYFGFVDALEALFGRSVDLVEEAAVRNPYIRAGINRSRELVYGP